MTDYRNSTALSTGSERPPQGSIGQVTARLLLASALGSLAYFGVSPEPALGFVCVGNFNGAVVGDGFAGVSAGGDGATIGAGTLNPAAKTLTLLATIAQTQRSAAGPTPASAQAPAKATT